MLLQNNLLTELTVALLELFVAHLKYQWLL